ncbi:MAG: hypothetical protein KGI54_08300 [Pseudomonadota bacterium]|nr:hypothetical protein [Pseudomonadota bacterium]
MAYSYVQYTGDGSTQNFSITFPFISLSHIEVRLAGALQSTGYTTSGTTVSFTTAPASSVLIDIRRNTPKSSSLVTFVDASVLTQADLNLAQTQNLYISQEALDTANASITYSPAGYLDAGSKRLANLVAPVSSQDAVTLAYGNANYGGTAAANAATSAASAATSAASAASSASSSSSSASSSASSATAAAASAIAAANSVTSLGFSLSANNSWTGTNSYSITPTFPTASPGTNSTKGATTAFVAASFAPLSSPALTGTPTAPTAAGGDNSTQLATTAFIANAFAASIVGNGHTKLANGLIIQWGLYACTGVHGAYYSPSFPIAFPTGCLAVYNQYCDSSIPTSSSGGFCYTTTLAPTYYTFQWGWSTGGTGATNIRWLAIGY